MLLKSGTKKESKDTNASIKKKVRKLQDKVMVDVVAVTTSDVIFFDPITHETYTWSEQNNSLLIPLSTVISILNNSSILLSGLYLGILDFSGTKDLTLEELIKGLGLDDVYSKFNYDIGNIDGMLIDSKVEDIERVLNGLDREIICRFVERYRYLKKLKEIDDLNKEALLYRLIGKKLDL